MIPEELNQIKKFVFTSNVNAFPNRIYRRIDLAWKKKRKSCFDWDYKVYKLNLGKNYAVDLLIIPNHKMTLSNSCVVGQYSLLSATWIEGKKVLTEFQISVGTFSRHLILDELSVDLKLI